MGKLVYVIGPSGAGKDRLLRYARSALPEGTSIIFAHRYITRPPAPNHENHVYLSPAEFELRRQRGCFALHWDSHGYSYGVGREIELWRGLDLIVVVNGSRAYLPEAVRRYPDLVPVEIRADPAILRERLTRRNRESAADIGARLERAAALTIEHANLRTIDNSGDLARAGHQLIGILFEQLAQTQNERYMLGQGI